MRGELEEQRLERLSKMHDTIRALKNLPDKEKERVVRKLRSVMEPVSTETSTAIQVSEPQIEVEVEASPVDIIGLLLASEEQEPATHSPEQGVRPTEQRSQPEGETEKANPSVPVPYPSPLTSSPLIPLTHSPPILPTSSPFSPPFESTETKVNIPTVQVEPLQTLMLPRTSDDPDFLSVSPSTPPAQADATLPPTTSPPSRDSHEEPTAYLRESAPEKEEESLEGIADTLAKLYKEYQDSITTFNSVITSSQYSSAAVGDVPIFLSSTPAQSVDSCKEKGRTDQSDKPISEASSEEPSIILRASKHQVQLTDMESEAWSLLSSAASTTSPALWEDNAATVDASLPDQPSRGISADRSSATSTTDGETAVMIVGTTSDTVDEINSDKDDQDVSQPSKNAALSTPSRFVERAEETFHNVEQRSEAIAASYRRRIDAPTDKTYKEAQSLLQALGVPVVVTEGGEEAEAVASALVLEGRGDYVASDDTVRNAYSMETLLRIS